MWLTINIQLYNTIKMTHKAYIYQKDYVTNGFYSSTLKISVVLEPLQLPLLTVFTSDCVLTLSTLNLVATLELLLPVRPNAIASGC